MPDFENPLDREDLEQRYKSRREVYGDDIARPKTYLIGKTFPDGTTATVVTSGDYGRVWVREPGADVGDAIQAVNQSLQPHEISFNRPVSVRKRRKQLYIINKAPDSVDYDADGAPPRAQTIIDREQYESALLRATVPASMSALVSEGMYDVNGSLYRVTNQQTVDFTGVIPGSNALAYRVDLTPSNGSLTYIPSDAFSLKSMEAAFDAGEVDRSFDANGTIVAGYLRLYAGQAAIEREDVLIAERFVHIGKETEADKVAIATIAPDEATVQDFIKLTAHAGWISGGAITDNGDGTVDIASGTGFIRTSDSRSAPLLYFSWPTTAGISLVDGSGNYIYVDYNGGTPQVAATTSGSTIRANEHDKFELYEIVRDGNIAHIGDHKQKIGDWGRDAQRWTYSVFGLKRADHEGGLIIGETGARNITVTAGKIWIKFVDTAIAAIDTSGADSFDRYYRDGIGGWTKQAAQTQWDNTHYDDGDGVLGSTNPNKFSVQYFYTDADGQLVSLFGQAVYNTLAGAENDAPPSTVPVRIEDHALIIGRIIFQHNDATAQAIESTFITVFDSAGVTDHGALAGLSDDDHAQYALLAGRSGGQNLEGGVDANDDLHLGTTAHATKGDYYLDDIINNVGLGNNDGHVISDTSGILNTLKSNLVAVAAPINTDDASAGYSPGSIWVDITNDKAYICAHNAVNNAVWKQVGAGSSATFSGARVYHSANQSIANTTNVQLAFNSERFDTDAYHDNVVNNSRLTAPFTGKYLITGHVAFDSNSTGFRMIRIITGGAVYWAQNNPNANATQATQLFISTVIAMTAADYAQIEVRQNSGGALNVLASGNFSAEATITYLGA